MEWDTFVLLFREKDTWKPGPITYDSIEKAQDAAERYGRGEETILIIPAISVLGEPCCGVGSHIR